MSTSYNFLVSFYPLIPQISQYRYEESHLRSFILLQFKNVAKFQFVKMILINFAASAFMCTLFCGIQFLKKSRSNVRKRYQTNIVTFDQNFYFYLIVTLINMILTIFVVLSGEMTELVLIASYLIKLLSIWLFRPLITLILLKRNMPEFFQDYKVTTSRFIIISQQIYPRRQSFMTFKHFNQNARFGTEKKFFMINEEFGNQLTSTSTRKNENDNQNIAKLPDVCR